MKSLRLFAAVLAAVLALSSCTGKNAVDQTAGGQFRFVQVTKKGDTIKPADRKPVGTVTGELLDGASWSLADLRGKVVAVNFWATWCGPCQVESPNFDSVYRKLKPAVEFVGIDIKDIRSKAQSFVSDFGLTYPIVYDEEAKTALRMGNIPVVGLPVTILIDKQQRVAAVYQQALQPADITPVLTALAAE